MVYVATRRGFKAGGFNAFAIDPSIFEYGPEETTDVEVGLKGGWRLSDDIRLRATAAAYHSVVEDVQRFAFFFVEVGGQPVGATATRNAGKATINGVELSATAAVRPVFRGHRQLRLHRRQHRPRPGRRRRHDLRRRAQACRQHHRRRARAAAGAGRIGAPPVGHLVSPGRDAIPRQPRRRASGDRSRLLAGQPQGGLAQRAGLQRHARRSS